MGEKLRTRNLGFIKSLIATNALHGVVETENVYCDPCKQIQHINKIS